MIRADKSTGKNKRNTESKRTILSASVLLALGLLVFSQPVEAKNYYVSPSGSNGDGSNWKQAWNELDQINWNLIEAGDTVVIDGGRRSTTYHTRLVIPVSGAQNNPVSVTQSRHPHHSGNVIISGINNPISFPSGQPAHAQYPKHPPGIEINGSNIQITGNRRCGIQVSDHALVGVKIKEDTQNVLLNNIEIKKNGQYNFLNDFGGLVVNGGRHRFHNLNVHDNGGRNVIRNRTGAGSLPCYFTSCWVYNEDNGFSDGFDFRSDNPMNNGSAAVGLDRVYYSAIGPGLNSGVRFLGNAGGLYLAESLMLNAKQTNFTASSRNTNTRIILRNVTSFTTTTNPLGLRSRCERTYGTVGCYDIFYPQPNTRSNIRGGNTAKFYISNSIFYGGVIGFSESSNLTSRRNYQYNVTGNTTALASTLTDPLFWSAVASIPNDVSFNTMANTNFILSPKSPARGAGTRYVKRANMFGSRHGRSGMLARR